MRRLSGQGSVSNSITTLPTLTEWTRKARCDGWRFCSADLCSTYSPCRTKLEAKRRLSKMFWDQVTIFDEIFLCNICTALGYFSKPGLMRLCMSGAIWAESSVAARSHAVGNFVNTNHIRGRVEWMRWREREGEKTERIRGDWKRQSGERVTERLLGRENTRTNRSPRINNILLLELFSWTKLELEDCYFFHSWFFELHQCDEMTRMCRFLLLYLWLCAK